jgi:hypothetical protein
VGIASNLAAVGFSLVSYAAHKQGPSGKELGKNTAGISGVCLCIGTYVETTGVHLVPAFRSHEPAALDITTAFVELIGNTGGLVALGGARAKDPDSTGVGFAIDGLCTFVSTLTGKFAAIVPWNFLPRPKSFLLVCNADDLYSGAVVVLTAPSDDH